MKTKLYIVPKIRVISNVQGKPLMASGVSKAPKRSSFSLSGDDGGVFDDTSSRLDTGWSRHGAF